MNNETSPPALSPPPPPPPPSALPPAPPVAKPDWFSTMFTTAASMSVASFASAVALYLIGDFIDVKSIETVFFAWFGLHVTYTAVAVERSSGPASATLVGSVVGALTTVVAVIGIFLYFLFHAVASGW